VFCKRIRNYEYDASGFGAVSFEPLNPVTPGHRLFLPVRHVRNAWDMSGLAAAMALASHWAQDQPGDFNLITSAGPAATQTIEHLHVHYVPRTEGDGLPLPWTPQKQRANGYVTVRLDEDLGDRIAEALHQRTDDNVAAMTGIVLSVLREAAQP
jgi:diadenosine tetraphosphate (Ap4A) HIT family hydrolase